MEFLPRNPRRGQTTAGSDCLAGAFKEMRRGCASRQEMRRGCAGRQVHLCDASRQADGHFALVMAVRRYRLVALRSYLP